MMILKLYVSDWTMPGGTGESSAQIGILIEVRYFEFVQAISSSGD